MRLRAIPLLLALLLAACAGDQSPMVNLDEPPQMTAGVDVTYPEGRVIEDSRFAAALVTGRGEIQRFDDIGRLISIIDGVNDIPAAAWVYDYETGAAIPVESAYYVASANLVTPRGSGLMALADLDRARVLANLNSGRVLGWEDLPGYLAAAPALPISPPTSGAGLGGLLEADR